MTNVISMMDRLKDEARTSESTRLWLIRAEQLQDTSTERVKKERAKHNEKVKKEYRLCGNK